MHATFPMPRPKPEPRRTLPDIDAASTFALIPDGGLFPDFSLEHWLDRLEQRDLRNEDAT